MVTILDSAGVLLTGDEGVGCPGAGWAGLPSPPGVRSVHRGRAGLGLLALLFASCDLPMMMPEEGIPVPS